MLSKSWRNRISHWVLSSPLAWQFVFVLLFCLVSKLALTPSDQIYVSLGWDKLNHLSAFIALAFAAWLGFRSNLQSQRLSLLGLLVYGGVIEIIQLYVPGRSSEWLDLLADAIGIAAGAILAAGLIRMR